jgi:MFS family permease
MTTLSPSPLLVALMQTAASLPFFLLAFPAGALADVVDRRRVLLITQGWMLAAAAALGVLTIAGVVTPPVLLGLTFALGIGSAMTSPAWQAITPELPQLCGHHARHPRPGRGHLRAQPGRVHGA